MLDIFIPFTNLHLPLFSKSYALLTYLKSRSDNISTANISMKNVFTFSDCFTLDEKAGDFSNKNSHLEQRLEGACLRRLFHEKYHNQFNNFLCQQGEITTETKTFDNLLFVLFVCPHPILGPNIRLQLFQTQIWIFLLQFLKLPSKPVNPVSLKIG